MGANSATGDVSVERLPLAAGADAASLSERQMAQLRLLLACDALWGGACVTERGVGRRLRLAEGEGLDAGLLAGLKAMGLVGSVSRERFTKMVTAYWLTRDGWRVLHPQPVEEARADLVAHEPRSPHAVAP